jgi:pimeloyl-ACP methyl ester carboxylesterase
MSKIVYCIDLGGRAAIIGHSFGGMLAVYFARTYPDMTAVLALENPIGLEDYCSGILL